MVQCRPPAARPRCHERETRHRRSRRWSASCCWPLRLTIDFPKTSGGGFKGDESTYYVLAHSLARDGDFQFEHRDLMRVWEEFPGPQGIFLKRGKSIDIEGLERLSVRPLDQAGGSPAGHAVVFLEVVYLSARCRAVRVPVRHERVPRPARGPDRARICS